MVKQVLLLFSLFYMTFAVDITDGCGLSNKVHRWLLAKKSKVMLYCRSLNGKRHLTSCTLLTRQSASVLKVGMPCKL